MPNPEEGELAMALSLIERVITETLSDCHQRGLSGRRLTGLKIQVDEIHLTPYASKAAFRLAAHKAFYTALRQAEVMLFLFGIQTGDKLQTPWFLHCKLYKKCRNVFRTPIEILRNVT